MAIITVSRGTHSLGASLAEQLAGVLGYPCLGREAARAAAERSGISPDLMERKVEESPSLWERMTAERKVYVSAMAAFLSEQALEGRLVYHGYAGHLLLKGMPGLLKVRVIAPIDARVRLVVDKQGLSAKAALAHIRKLDDARTRWTRFVFGEDWQDPGLYDLVLNLGGISIDAACEAVAGLARRPEFSPERTDDELRDFALAARIRLALTTAPLTRAWEQAVEVKNGIAFVTGSVPDDPRYADSGKRFKGQVSELLLSIEGVKHVSFVER